MTDTEPASIDAGTVVEHACCDADRSVLAGPLVLDSHWHRSARWARRLAWISLGWMTIEAAVGLWQGLVAGSIALMGWALGSAVEGLASVIVIWRFSGARTMSQTAERRAQRALAVSFWLIAPYIAAESIRNLVGEHRAEPTVIGIVVTALALLAMPLLGYVKRRLGVKLGSAATAGEGTQNYLCAAQAGAVLAGLMTVAAWPGSWWLDPIIGLVVAAVAAWEGVQFWRGEACDC